MAEMDADIAIFAEEKVRMTATPCRIEWRPGLPECLRELVAHPNDIVFYHVLAEARTVQILRVKHAVRQTP